MSLMSLEHVSKIYPKGSRPALDDISLDVNRGDFVFLVGASGSGKTTLLSLLLREEEASSGEIHVAGNDLRRLANRQVPQYRRSLGFIFQDYKLLNNKTVYQNVAFALEVIGTSRATIRSLVPRVLETVGLTGKENNYPHELSGGEAQRVAIARAYVNHPQIILADEPTGNLDPTTSLGIMEVLDAINRTGTTIVMATHNEEIVNSMRKRVVELHAGKIVRDEREGSYDSALYFPDADVEQNSKAQQSVDLSYKNSESESAKTEENKNDSYNNSASTASSKNDANEFDSDSENASSIDSSKYDAKSEKVESDSKERESSNNSQSSNSSSSSSSFSYSSEFKNGAQHKRLSKKELRALQAQQALDLVANTLKNSESENEGIARLAQSVHSGRTGRYGEVFQSLETTMTWGRGLVLDSNHDSESGNDSESGHSSEPGLDHSSDPNSGSNNNPPAPPVPPEFNKNDKKRSVSSSSKADSLEQGKNNAENSDNNSANGSFSSNSYANDEDANSIIDGENK